MSSFYYPEMPASQIANALTKSAVAIVREEDLAAPTANFAFALFSSILDYFQPHRNAEIDFGVIQLLDNPEQHEYAMDALNLYHRAKEFLASISCNEFRLFDLLKPEPRRMIAILSAVVNFIYYREEKLSKLQIVMDQLPACDERKSQLEERLAELKKQCANYETARDKEEPMVHEVEAEVKKLKQSIQEYNKQQMLMRNQAKELKDKADAIDSKISQADFELLKKAEENSKLLSEVVQSPDKLQRPLEEKRKKLAEVKNSERVAIQSVQEKNAILEVYLKASEKMSKLLSKVQATQEQINSAKNMEKEVKALKAKLSNDAVSAMSLDAKLLELQGKVIQAEELLRAAENERLARITVDIQKLNNARTEVQQALKFLESREKNVEDMVARSDTLCREVDTVRESESLKQQKLLSKFQEVLQAFHSYSNRTGRLLEVFPSEVMSMDGNSLGGALGKGDK